MENYYSREKIEKAINFFSAVGLPIYADQLLDYIDNLENQKLANILFKESFDHDMFYDVVTFHTHYGLPLPKGPTQLSQELFNFRVKFLQEELCEFIEAWEQGDLTKQVDGLLDLVYVALGSLVLMGVDGRPCWDAIQKANMTGKRRATKEESPRGGKYDVIKTHEFVSPDATIKKLLRLQQLTAYSNLGEVLDDQT